MFGQAAWALVEEHRRQRADPDAGVEAAAESLATTLLIAVVTAADKRSPAHVRVAAVGDSQAPVIAGGEYRQIAGDPPAGDGLLGDGVKALPRAVHGARERSCALERGGVLLPCTDGLALPLAGGAGEVAQTLSRELARPPDIIDFARLLDFSRSTYDDDRTLVAVWPGR